MSGWLKWRGWAAVLRAVVGSVVTVISIIVQQLTGSRRFSAALFAPTTLPSILWWILFNYSCLVSKTTSTYFEGAEKSGRALKNCRNARIRCTFRPLRWWKGSNWVAGGTSRAFLAAEFRCRFAEMLPQRRTPRFQTQFAFFCGRNKIGVPSISKRRDRIEFRRSWNSLYSWVVADAMGISRQYSLSWIIADDFKGSTEKLPPFDIWLRQKYNKKFVFENKRRSARLNSFISCANPWNCLQRVNTSKSIINPLRSANCSNSGSLQNP